LPDASGTAKAMSLDALQGVIADAEKDSLAYMGSKLSEQRKDALKYYFAEPFDPKTGLQAVPGRSSVIMQEVADTIDWIMPDLLKKFASGDRAVEFQPNSEEGEASAQQATAYVNYVFFHDNPGFMILHDMFQDALVQKNGIVKVWWDDQVSDEIRELNDLPTDAFALLNEDPDVEIIAHTENAAAGPESGVTPGAMGEAGAYSSSAPAEPTHDVRYRLKTGKCCVHNVEPENFLMAKGGKDIKSTPYCADRQRKTLSDLIAMGFEKSQVETLPSDDDAETDEAEERRVGDDDDGGALSSREGVMREVWFTEHYILVDFDGDGVAERRKVQTAGSAHTILKRKGEDGKYAPANDPWDGPPPYASVTPKPKPHRFFGRSIADIVMDLQRISTMLTRQLLDNLYASNNPRHVVSEYVNLDDLMSPRLGSFVRLSEGRLPQEGHVQPIALPFVAKDVIPVMEYIEGIKENRTGVTRYNQGTDSDSLNKTARGITQIMSAAQQRIELIARIFAETGVSDMFMLILQCVSKYQNKPRVIKVAGDWTPIDPRGWESMFKMNINVGLGTGNKDQQLMHLQTIGAMQKEIAAAGNPGGIIQPVNVYNVGRKMVENAGLKDPELFFTDPGKNPQAEQPRPDPDMAEVERKAKRDEAELAIKDKQVDGTLALKAKEQQGNMALKAQGQMADTAMKARGQQVDQDMKREGAEADRSLQREGMQQEQQGASDRTSEAVNAVRDMLKEFMQQQNDRDAEQNRVIAELASKLMPQQGMQQ
jgi:hypothetical protein